MDIRLLKIFRRRASKEICLRRQAGNRYEVVCPINEDNALGYFTKPWVHINHPKASITFKMCIPNGSTFVRKQIIIKAKMNTVFHFLLIFLD